MLRMIAGTRENSAIVLLSELQGSEWTLGASCHKTGISRGTLLSH